MTDLHFSLTISSKFISFSCSRITYCNSLIKNIEDESSQPIMSLTYAEKVQHCEAALDHIFQNKLLILEALHMTIDHILWDDRMHAIGKNERLAILGNNIMRAYFCNQWFETRRAKGLSLSVLSQ